jgi:hypothetical protein
MVEKEISDEELEELIKYFINDVILQKSKWIGMEIPPLHRLFPHNIREIFMLWYNIGKENDNKVKLIFNVNEFHDIFMKQLKSKKITFKIKEFKSDYNRANGSYKYIFNNLRLTCLGLYLYLNILPNIKNKNSTYYRIPKLARII